MQPMDKLSEHFCTPGRVGETVEHFGVATSFGLLIQGRPRPPYSRRAPPFLFTTYGADPSRTCIAGWSPIATAVPTARRNFAAA